MEASRRRPPRRRGGDARRISRPAPQRAGRRSRAAEARDRLRRRQGQLALPVAGAIVKTFGAADAFGGVEKGVSIATPPAATVATPIDGWVAFSGPYRTYGQLLIINAGGGYYMVLAGMDRINVSVGQFVLAGEPVAVMGDGSARTAAAAAIGAEQPVLYIELRKNGRRSIRGRGGRRQTSKRRADDAQGFLSGFGRGDRRGGGSARARRLCWLSRRAPTRRPPTPIASSTCSATCSRKSAPIMSRSRTRANWSRPRSTACCPRSIRIRATWTPRPIGTCRSRPRASSAASASRSPRRTARSRSSPRSTTRRPPRPASCRATSSSASTTTRCRASRSTRRSTRCAARSIRRASSRSCAAPPRSRRNSRSSAT